MPMTPLVKAGMFRIAAVLFAFVAAFNAYRIKKITTEAIGWDWGSGPGYIFSDAYQGDHRILLILGCYGSALLAIILLVVSIKIGRAEPRR